MAIFGLFKKDVIYFPGCYSSAFLKEKIENYKKILKKLGISSATKSNDSDFLCCGGILEEAGYEKQLRKLAKENADYLEKNEIVRVITSCPRCFKTLDSYKFILPNFAIKIEFILDAVLKSIKADPSLIKTLYHEQIVYYDSCYLARYSKFIEPPRELLKLFGYEVLELPLNKEETMCCGNCGNLEITNPALSEEIASSFIKKLLKLKIKKIIVSDPHAYYFLKNMLKKLNIKVLDLIEISEVICDSIGIKISKEESELESEMQEKMKSISQKEQEQVSEILNQTN